MGMGYNEIQSGRNVGADSLGYAQEIASPARCKFIGVDALIYTYKLFLDTIGEGFYEEFFEEIFLT